MPALLEVGFLVERVGSKSGNIDPLKKSAQQISLLLPLHACFLNEELAVFAWLIKKTSSESV